MNMFGIIELNKENVLMHVKYFNDDKSTSVTDETVDVTNIAIAQLKVLFNAFCLDGIYLENQLYSPGEFLDLATDMGE